MEVKGALMEEKAIVVQDLVKNYPHITAVDNVSFAVDKGKFSVFSARTRGKTTTIRILLTLIQPTSGKRSFITSIQPDSEDVRRMWRICAAGRFR